MRVPELQRTASPPEPQRPGRPPPSALPPRYFFAAFSPGKPFKKGSASSAAPGSRCVAQRQRAAAALALAAAAVLATQLGPHFCRTWISLIRTVPWCACSWRLASTTGTSCQVSQANGLRGTDQPLMLLGPTAWLVPRRCDGRVNQPGKASNAYCHCHLCLSAPSTALAPSLKTTHRTLPCLLPLQAWRGSTRQLGPARSSCAAACGIWLCLLGTAPAWPPRWRFTRPSCCRRTRPPRWGPEHRCATSRARQGGHLTGHQTTCVRPWRWQMPPPSSCSLLGCSSTSGRGALGAQPRPTPLAQVSGPPGNAFELVYAGVTDRVRANMHAADPVLGEWIRCAGRWGVRARGARAGWRC